MEQDEINDLNKDLLHLHNRLEDNINNATNKLEYIEQDGIVNEHEGQGNHFGNANNKPQAQNEYFRGANNNNDNDNDDNDDDNKHQNHDRNNQNQVSEDNTDGNSSHDDYNVCDGNSQDNHQDDHDSLGVWDHSPKDKEHKDDNVDKSGGDSQDMNDIKQVKEDTSAERRRNRWSMIWALSRANNGTGLNGPYCHEMGSHICPILGAMVVVKQAGIRMMKE